MKILRAALVASLIGFFVACDDNGTGGTGGSGGSSGAAGTTGTAGGGGGTTGTGGGWAASCPGCVTCVNANCASAVATCQANTGCNAIYQCASGCSTPIETCIQNNVGAAITWATSVSTCINQNCATQCTY
jgi:hypothetical protein